MTRTATATFSNPVLVDEGVAFCATLSGKRKAVVVATKALLDSLPGEDRMDAFRAACVGIQASACRLLLEGADSPLFLEPQHLDTPAPTPQVPEHDGIFA